MSRIMVESSTVEEKFMFGSPPLLNGFTYTSCRSQEGIYSSSHEYCSFQNECSQGCFVPEETTTTDLIENNMTTSPNFGRMNGGYGYSRSYVNFPQNKHGFRNGSTSLVDNFNHLKLNSTRTSHVDNGIKLLEQAGIKIQNIQNPEPVFKKRKDLRVLKAVLSNERFREVVMKFGDGDEGGREIVESVHKAMKNSNLSSVSCMFCTSESLVYENFPVVDGTLFLTPVQLSRCCVKFSEATSENNERYMGYICVKCMEGKPKSLRCSACALPWNGSFFQIGTLYSYNILFSMPCCQQRVSCNNCFQSIIDLSNGEASNLFFSYFSKKTTCPHCYKEDFHFVKSLSTISEL